MLVCVVKSCPNSLKCEENVTFFCLPSNFSDRIKWEKFSGQKFKGHFPDHAVFCSRHFRPESVVQVGDKKKLLKHAAPVLHPPPDVDVQAISRELAKKSNKRSKKSFLVNPTDDEKAAYVDQILKLHHSAQDDIDENEEEDDSSSDYEDLNDITANKMLDTFKRNSSSPWGWLESESKFYFYKTTLPPDVDHDQEMPILPMIGECLVIDKTQDFKMTLIRRGEQIELCYVAPQDFNMKFQTIFPRTMEKVQSFIRRLKARSDPVPKLPEVLRMNAHCLNVMGKWCLNNVDQSPDERLGSALKFLSNQMTLWSTKCLEYNKVPSFTPSAIRLALLVRAQSKQAYSTLRECDQLILPPDNVLTPFNLVKAPQGLTNDRISALKSLADKMSPLDRYVSVIIDETLLTPRLNFDSNGMIIGHAVNDTIGEDESGETALATPRDALATKMICYMVQGIAQNFHHVVAMYPVMNPSIEFMKKTLLEVLSSLHQIGFQVLVVIGAHSLTNKKIFKLLSRKTDENLENEPVIKHPCDQDADLILSFDPVGLIQSIRNDLFRREEFPVDRKNDDPDAGSISWVLLASLKDIEEGLKEDERKAPILQGPVSQIIKSHRLERARIDLIAQLFSPQVIDALRHYASVDAEMWPKNDVEATVGFMESSHKFFDAMNVNPEDVAQYDSLDCAKSREIQAVREYMKNIAIPCGVVAKSTGQAVVQACNALLKLADTLIAKIGISPIYTSRLQKRALWAEMVEHTLHREKVRFAPAAGGGFLPTSRQVRAKSRRIPDDVLPPRIPEPATATIDDSRNPESLTKRRGRKRKQLITMPTVDEVASTNIGGLLDGKVILLDDCHEIIQITPEQAQQLGLKKK